MKIAKCRACGAPIFWLKTQSGKPKPVDGECIFYSIGGTKRCVTKDGVVISCEFEANEEQADGRGYIPHWATCPQAERFRRR